MGILDIFRNRTEERAITSLPSGLLGEETSAGETVDSGTLYEIPAAWMAINTISNSIGMAGVGVYSVDVGDPEAEAEVEPDHPLATMLNYGPVDYIDGVTWRQMIATHMLTHGNSFWKVDFTQTGVPVFASPLLPESVTVEFKDGVLQYEYLPQNSTQQRVYTSDEVLHFKGVTHDGLRGIAMQNAMRNQIGLNVATTRWAGSFFRGDIPPYLLSAEEPMTEEQKDNLRTAFKDRKVKGGAAIDNNKITFQKLMDNPEDTQLLQTRSHNDKEVSRMFGSPLTTINDDSARTYDNVGQESLIFVARTLKPVATAFESAFNHFFFSPTRNGDGTVSFEDNRRYFVKLDLSGAYVTDPMEILADLYEAAGSQPVLTVNEVREILQRPPSEDEAANTLVTVQPPEPEPEQPDDE